MKNYLKFLVLTCLFSIDLSTPALAKKVPWPDVTIGSKLGIQVKPDRTNDDELKRIKDYGFSFLRYDMRWSEVEYQRGRYDWRRFDDFIERMRAHNLKAIIILNSGNKIYTEQVDVSPAKPFGYSILTAAPSRDKDIDAFIAFATEAVKRYGIEDIIWEIWNEPNILAFWPPKPDPVIYAQLAAKTCESIRLSSPEATIIAPGLAGLPDETFAGFLGPLLESSAGSCLDALSLHPYRHSKLPETVIEDYQVKVKPFVASYRLPNKDGLPIISGEWGYPSNKVTEEQQADYALRAHLSNLISGIALSIWYEWKNSIPGPAPYDVEAHFGLLDYNGNDKPSGAFIRTILPQIKDAIIEERLPFANVNCFALRLRHPDGNEQLLAWISNIQMASGTMQVIHDAKNNTYRLTSRPQLLAYSSGDSVSCD